MSLGNTILLGIIFSAVIVFLGAMGFMGGVTVPNPDISGPSGASVQELSDGMAGQTASEFNMGSSLWMMFKALGQGVTSLFTLPLVFGEYLAMAGAPTIVVSAIVVMITGPFAFKILSGLWTWISGRYL